MVLYICEYRKFILCRIILSINIWMYRDIYKTFSLTIMNQKLLFLDIETGGIGLDKSLLTAYFATYDQDFNLLGELDLKLKPDDDIYHVDGRALAEVNLLDIRDLWKNSITYKAAATVLYNHIKTIWELGDSRLVTPVGHNVKFDIHHITDKLVSKGSWDKYISYRTMDTCSIARYLQFIGRLPPELSCGLDSLKEFFSVKVEGNAHEAKSDVLACVEVFKGLINI